MFNIILAILLSSSVPMNTFDTQPELKAGTTDGDVRKTWCEKNGGFWDKKTKTCE